MNVEQNQQTPTVVFNIKVTEQTLQFIINKLIESPYAEVADLINDLKNQGNAEIEKIKAKIIDAEIKSKEAADEKYQAEKKLVAEKIEEDRIAKEKADQLAKNKQIAEDKKNKKKTPVSENTEGA